MALPSSLKSILRDCDLSQLTWSDDIVIERILRLGEIDIINNLFRHVSLEQIKNSYESHYVSFDRRNQSLRNNVFNIHRDLTPFHSQYEQYTTFAPTRSFWS